MDEKLRIAITIGDTNGIGPEVILKTLAVSDILELFTPVVYGSPRVLNFHRKALNLPAMNINVIYNTDDVRDDMVNVLDCCDDEVKIDLGEPGKAAGRAARMALERATADVVAGGCDVLVTAPINKDNIHGAEFPYTGHTDYLEATVGEGAHALMMLTAGDLRVALATVHQPIATVPASLTVDLLTDRLRTLDYALRRDFAIERPRIAVLALNPHAGENGLLGDEEHQVILPAINSAYDNDHILAFGPFAADGFFGSRTWKHFDAVLAMYHDQGLAPFKAIAMGEGVNCTTGLPIVRTSPDHGTGYDIAGKGIANEQSMRGAIYAAIDIWRNRQAFDEASANPLQRSVVERKTERI